MSVEKLIEIYKAQLDALAKTQQLIVQRAGWENLAEHGERALAVLAYRRQYSGTLKEINDIVVKHMHHISSR